LSLLPDHAQTTLVRYILNERHGFRIAVILNEYGGETGLESAFVQDEQVRRVTFLGCSHVLPSMGCLTSTLLS
jgi:G3E family GTPase